MRLELYNLQTFLHLKNLLPIHSSIRNYWVLIFIKMRKKEKKRHSSKETEVPAQENVSGKSVVQRLCIQLTRPGWNSRTEGYGKVWLKSFGQINGKRNSSECTITSFLTCQNITLQGSTKISYLPRIHFGLNRVVLSFCWATIIACNYLKVYLISGVIAANSLTSSPHKIKLNHYGNFITLANDWFINIGLAKKSI